MRSNLPVTQKEFELPEGVTLMSMTDPQSRIVYANAAFIATSGFDRQELIGQPHNLVRHPDMPPQAFADMWATLKAGQSWTGLVKNRRKDGDHYWVRANATPVIRGGRLTGYMSVRTRPERSEVAAAERLYAAVREGRARHLRFHRGLVLRSGWLGRTAWGRTMSLRGRVLAALSLAGAGGVAAAAAGGLGGGALMASAGLGLAVTAAAAGWLHAGLVRPLQGVLQQAQAVAAGHTDARPPLDRVDEIGMLQRAVNQAGLNLRSLVDDVAEQVGGVQLASAEIAQGNNDLSGRTEEAASSLQQTAASLEQMTANVGANAGTAQQAAQLAGAASAAAAQGGSVVGRVVGTMHEITSSARRIADITAVIDGIAFQTNILALNAAVEAARAGDQGRGFAVVAGEVRSLAQRSAVAAKEIKSLIGDSVTRAEAGTQLADDAGRAMEGIVTQVQRVTELIAAISQASDEQAGGIGQVNAAVSQLDQVTQQNAALVEESAAAAESLKGQAGRLVDAVGVYSHG